jgi:hypothetical protein
VTSNSCAVCETQHLGTTVTTNRLATRAQYFSIILKAEEIWGRQNAVVNPCMKMLSRWISSSHEQPSSGFAFAKSCRKTLNSGSHFTNIYFEFKRTMSILAKQNINAAGN